LRVHFDFEPIKNRTTVGFKSADRFISKIIAYKKEGFRLNIKVR